MCMFVCLCDVIGFCVFFVCVFDSLSVCSCLCVIVCLFVFLCLSVWLFVLLFDYNLFCVLLCMHCEL